MTNFKSRNGAHLLIMASDINCDKMREITATSTLTKNKTQIIIHSTPASSVQHGSQTESLRGWRPVGMRGGGAMGGWGGGGKSSVQNPPTKR